MHKQLTFMEDGDYFTKIGGKMQNHGKWSPKIGINLINVTNSS